jgi:Tol biopolymer transport system component
VMAIACALVAVGAGPASANSLSTTTLITKGDGYGANAYVGNGRHSAVSENGDTLVFSAYANNLVPVDANNTSDIFVYNKITKQISLISTNVAGFAANGASTAPSVSADGRYIAYITEATDLVVEDGQLCPSGACTNIILHDLYLHTNKLVNRNTLGLRIDASSLETPAISGDGRSVVFQSRSSISLGDQNDTYDILWRDTVANVTRLVSVDDFGHTGAQKSSDFSINDDGRFVAFRTASKLIPGDVDNTEDVFLRDIQMGTTSLVSAMYNGSPQPNKPTAQPSISKDGRYVAFTGWSDQIVPGDTNSATDVFLRDMQLGTTKRISINSKGQQGNFDSQHPDISSDGKYIVFSSFANNLIRFDPNLQQDVFIHYRDFGVTRLVSRASHAGAPAMGGESQEPQISGDGKTITFVSRATNLHPTPLQPGRNLYLHYNPVVAIPYYDTTDMVDFPRW